MALNHTTMDRKNEIKMTPRRWAKIRAWINHEIRAARIVVLSDREGGEGAYKPAYKESENFGRLLTMCLQTKKGSSVEAENP